jgi:hypothetical protein
MNMAVKVRLVECGSYIPTRRGSDRKKHAAAAWKWLERSLEALTEVIGPSRLCVRWYVDPKTKKPLEEPIRRYEVALRRKDLGHLRSLLASACAVFAQTQVYLSVAGHVEYVQG